MLSIISGVLCCLYLLVLYVTNALHSSIIVVNNPIKERFNSESALSTIEEVPGSPSEHDVVEDLSGHEVPEEAPNSPSEHEVVEEEPNSPPKHDVVEAKPSSKRRERPSSISDTPQKRSKRVAPRSSGNAIVQNDFKDSRVGPISVSVNDDIESTSGSKLTESAVARASSRIRSQSSSSEVPFDIFAQSPSGSQPATFSQSEPSLSGSVISGATIRAASSESNVSRATIRSASSESNVSGVISKSGLSSPSQPSGSRSGSASSNDSNATIAAGSRSGYATLRRRVNGKVPIRSPQGTPIAASMSESPIFPQSTTPKATLKKHPTLPQKGTPIAASMSESPIFPQSETPEATPMKPPTVLQKAIPKPSKVETPEELDIEEDFGFLEKDGPTTPVLPKAKVDPKAEAKNVPKEDIDGPFGLKWFGDGTIPTTKQQVEERKRMYEQFMDHTYDASTHVQSLKDKIMKEKVTPIHEYRKLLGIPQKDYSLEYFTSQKVYDRVDVNAVIDDINLTVQEIREICDDKRIVIETIAALMGYDMYGHSQECERYRKILTCSLEEFKESSLFYLKFKRKLKHYIKEYGHLYATCDTILKPAKFVLFPGVHTTEEYLPFTDIVDAENPDKYIEKQRQKINGFGTYKAFMEKMTLTKQKYITKEGLKVLTNYKFQDNQFWAQLQNCH